jgi:hypothetical protein
VHQIDTSLPQRPQLTEEQLQKMEENRLKALAKKREREERQRREQEAQEVQKKSAVVNAFYGDEE